MNLIRVFLIDDHRVVRKGLRAFLESFADIEVVGEASSGEEVLNTIGRWLPEVAVIDLLMPGGMDGIELTKRVRRLAPNTQVVVLTAYTDGARVVAALRAGAIGYVRKDADPEVLLAAVRAAAQGQSTLDPAIAGTVLDELSSEAEPRDNLTEREMEVLKLLAHGRTNREIAGMLVVGEETVKTHVGNILAKLHLVHRQQAMLYAFKQGLISLDEIDLSGADGR